MLKNLVSRLLNKRKSLSHDQAVSSAAVEHVENFAAKLERAAARRLLGRTVVIDGPIVGTLAWIGRPGEPTLVSTGTWAPGFAGLYMQAPADRLPVDASSKKGYLVYVESTGRWYTASRVRLP